MSQSGVHFAAALYCLYRPTVGFNIGQVNDAKLPTSSKNVTLKYSNVKGE